jgi:hypothetical protein
MVQTGVLKLKVRIDLLITKLDLLSRPFVRDFLVLLKRVNPYSLRARLISRLASKK